MSEHDIPEYDEQNQEQEPSHIAPWKRWVIIAVCVALVVVYLLMM